MYRADASSGMCLEDEMAREIAFERFGAFDFFSWTS
jgi:hypothetical protein